MYIYVHYQCFTQLGCGDLNWRPFVTSFLDSIKVVILLASLHYNNSKNDNDDNIEK